METVTLTIDRQTRLAHFPAGVLARIREFFTFVNPAHAEAERRGFYTGNIPREVKGWWEADGDLLVPRGATRHVMGIIQVVGLPYRVEDHRRTLAPVEFGFRGELRDFQAEAVEAMATRDFGTLAAPTGSGKTVMALALVARRRQPALIVVHTRELMEQWIDRIGTFLGIPARDVGIIGNGKKKIGHKVTVALVQSLYKCAQEFAPHVGHLVIDECHRTPSRTFTEAVTTFDCRHMTGLSATPWRRDGLSRLIYWYIGDKVHEVNKAALVEAGHVLAADVVWRETSFQPTYDPTEQYSRMLSELTHDPARNALIASDVAQEVLNGSGRVSLVLTDRKAHCDTLAAFLGDWGIEAAVLTGDLSNGQRQAVVEALNAGEVKVLCATGQLIGEGFDCRELSTLFLATPVKFNGRLLQYIGRVLRPASGKERARVYDYLDPVGVLRNAARARQREYVRNGWQLMEAA